MMLKWQEADELIERAMYLRKKYMISEETYYSMFKEADELQKEATAHDGKFDCLPCEVPQCVTDMPIDELIESFKKE